MICFFLSITEHLKITPYVRSTHIFVPAKEYSILSEYTEDLKIVPCVRSTLIFVQGVFDSS